jgi:reductive dehalogenase
MALLIMLVLICGLFFAAAVIFTIDSIREKEPRAPKVGLVSAMLFLALVGVTIYVPNLRIPIALALGALILFGVILSIPGLSNSRSLKGAMGYAVGEVTKFDERDTVFARNFSLPPGSEIYKQYYKRNPEREKPDAKRREKGGPVGRARGAIDNCYPPNVAMSNAMESFSSFLLSFDPANAHRVSGPESGSRSESKFDIDPAKATHIVKGFARYLGADLVGVCKTNPLWNYSHRGIVFDGVDTGPPGENWGQEIPDPLPYAVVIATEMHLEMIQAAPHMPVSVESELNYALGAFITNVLAQWFVELGYEAAPQFAGAYDGPLVPLAVDAGLGELGRQGFLIADEFGPCVRLFAVTTDMPLIPDRPIDLGAEEFCEKCLKCADSCPSRSIPKGEKVVFNGVEKWKLNEDTCFEYWARVGTGCCICMAICPFSRPNRSLHRVVRWMLRHSPLARKVLPAIDNFIYGKRWRSRSVPEWVRYPKGKQTHA